MNLVWNSLNLSTKPAMTSSRGRILQGQAGGIGARGSLISRVIDGNSLESYGMLFKAALMVRYALLDKSTLLTNAFVAWLWPDTLGQTVNMRLHGAGETLSLTPILAEEYLRTPSRLFIHAKHAASCSYTGQ